MGKRTKILEFTAKRKPGGGIHAPLRVSFEFNDADRRSALEKLLGATIKTAECWGMTDQLNEAMRRLTTPAAEK